MGRNSNKFLHNPQVKFCCDCEEWVEVITEPDPDGDGFITEMCKYCESTELLSFDKEVDKFLSEREDEEEYALNDENLIF